MPDQEQMAVELLRRQPGLQGILNLPPSLDGLPELPPGSPIRTLDQFRRDPLSGIVEMIKGAVTGNHPGGPSAQGIGALLSAALPFAKLRKFTPQELMSQGDDLYKRMVDGASPIQMGRTVKDYNPADYADKFKFSEHGNFYTEKFPHTADVRVHHPGLFASVEMDQVKGLNAGHAGARAAAANPNAERVRLVAKEPSTATLDRPSGAEELHKSEIFFDYLEPLTRLLGIP